MTRGACDVITLLSRFPLWLKSSTDEYVERHNNFYGVCSGRQYDGDEVPCNRRYEKDGFSYRAGVPNGVPLAFQNETGKMVTKVQEKECCGYAEQLLCCSRSRLTMPTCWHTLILEHTRRKEGRKEGKSALGPG